MAKDNDLTRVLVANGLEGIHRYYSIYPGQVVQNVDPKELNRLKVFVPGVQGGICLWALPRHQHGSQNTGFKYLAPKIGDWVWVSFEQGAATHPLWEYHSWAKQETPVALRNPNTAGIVLPCGLQMIVNDSNGFVDFYITGEWNTFAAKPIRIVSDLDVQVTSRKGNITLNATAEEGKVIINEGSNEGSVKIKELTSKLNNLIQELENLRNMFNTHIHPHPVGPTSATTSIVAAPFSTFKKEDYEDTKCTH